MQVDRKIDETTATIWDLKNVKTKVTISLNENNVPVLRELAPVPHQNYSWAEVPFRVHRIGYFFDCCQWLFGWRFLVAFGVESLAFRLPEIPWYCWAPFWADHPAVWSQSRECSRWTMIRKSFGCPWWKCWLMKAGSEGSNESWWCIVQYVRGWLSYCRSPYCRGWNLKNLTTRWFAFVFFGCGWWIGFSKLSRPYCSWCKVASY